VALNPTDVAQEVLPDPVSTPEPSDELIAAAR